MDQRANCARLFLSFSGTDNLFERTNKNIIAFYSMNKLYVFNIISN